MWFAERWRGIPDHPYEQGFDLKLWPQRLEMPLRWKQPKRVFVNSRMVERVDAIAKTVAGLVDLAPLDLNARCYSGIAGKFADETRVL